MSHAPDTDIPALRIGIDLGGTKIAAVALAADGEERASLRMPAPRGSYEATVRALLEVTARLEAQAAATGTVGIGLPGSIVRATGLVQGANLTWLNGRPLGHDLEQGLGRPVRLANDANCFALSEAVDGAGAGAASVFGIILGTGCGGGLVFQSRIVDGPNAIGGEWGHNPLPWSAPDEHPGPQCWCGRRGCMEMWVSGTGLAADHRGSTGEDLNGEAIVARAAAGNEAARATLARHASRLARGIAHVVNIFDPEVIVLGGGLSRLAHLYDELPGLVARHAFAAEPVVTIRPPRWGDASGVRGAAWLW